MTGPAGHRFGAGRRTRGRDAGMVTAELAACLPVLALILVVALGAVSIAGQRVQAQDAANQVARAAARADPAPAARLFQQTAPPGATVTTTTADGEVMATVRVTIRPLGGWLGSYAVLERAVALLEPSLPAPQSGATN